MSRGKNIANLIVKVCMIITRGSGVLGISGLGLGIFQV